MAGFSTILVPLDGSPPGERALPYAVALAERGGSRLLLLEVAVANLVTRNDPTTGQPYGVDTAAEYLSGVAAGLEGRVGAETVEIHGEPGPEIVEAADARGADLIAMSTHGRSGLGRWLYGSVADHVLRHARVPVLLVPATAEHRWPEPDGGRRPLVLVALDGSPAAPGAAQAGARLAQTLRADVLLLRVVDTGRPGEAGDGEAARAELGALAVGLREGGLEVDVAVASGPAARTISAQAADRRADVIALGTQGRGILGRPQLGSVAGELVRRSQVPLLLVRPPDSA